MKKNTHKGMIGIIMASIALTMFFGCGKPMPEWAEPAPNKNEKTGKWGFVYDGQTIIKYKYDDAGRFYAGLAPVKTNGKWGYVDNKGKDIITPKYDFAGVFNRDTSLAKVGLNGRHGLIDRTGKEIIPLKYDEIGDFANELIKVSLNGKWGFIDKAGKEIIPMKYDSAGDFFEGLANVSLEGKYGYINTAGKEAIPLIYDSAKRFWGGEAAVQQGDKRFLINKKGEALPYGKLLIGFVHETSQDSQGTRYRMLVRDKLTFVDEATGKEVSFQKIVIDGGTVVRMRTYTETEQRGRNDFGPPEQVTVAEFSTDNGKMMKYYSRGPLAFPITKKYTIENGKLTILE